MSFQEGEAHVPIQDRWIRSFKRDVIHRQLVDCLCKMCSQRSRCPYAIAGASAVKSRKIRLIVHALRAPNTCGTDDNNMGSLVHLPVLATSVELEFDRVGHNCAQVQDE